MGKFLVEHLPWIIFLNFHSLNFFSAEKSSCRIKKYLEKGCVGAKKMSLTAAGKLCKKN
jgi:hypothetical protein